MKFRLAIFTLLFATVLSSTSFAEWTRVGSAEDGTEYYVDFERIRNHSGYVYFWTLGDYPMKRHGSGSSVSYTRGDCEQFRIKYLNIMLRSGQMGQGDIVKFHDEEDTDWTYPSPNSMLESILENVCAR